MSRQVLYVAAPLRPTEDEIHQQFCLLAQGPAVMRPGKTATKEALRANLERAMRWLSWLRRSFPETTFIAPWICIVLSGDDDSDPTVRERAMRDNFATIERCDGIVLCGGRISEGMDREMRHGTHRVVSGCSWFSLAPTIGDIPEFRVYDLTCPMQPEPPLTQGELTATMSLDELNEVARTMWRK